MDQLGQPIVDFKDDVAFRVYTAQQFGILMERTKDLSTLSKEVPVLKQEVADIRKEMDDEKFWTNVKSLSGLGVSLVHGALHLLGLKKF